MTQAKRRSVIITFKPKEQRPDKGKDKLEVVSAAVAIQPTFFNARTLARGAAAGLPEDMIGYDCNQYAAPMVMASLTDAEIDALRKNGNVAAVEEDAPCYAVSDLLIEGQPSPLAETVPAGVAQIKAPAAWDCSRGKAIKVAVVDTGIDGTHPDLAAN